MTMPNVDFRMETVEDLEKAFIQIYLTNGGNTNWAVDTLEYEFYRRKNEAKEPKLMDDYIHALRLLYGPKKNNF